MRLSGRMDASISADENTADALDSLESLILSPTKGSFLQFCRAVPSPTVLNHKVTIKSSFGTELNMVHMDLHVDALSGIETSAKKL